MKFGLIAGAILSVTMVATMPFADRIGFDRMMWVGYTNMIVAFLMVFFGIRSYRDNAAGGSITFGRGFKLGIAITLIASLCYVLTWEVLNYTVSSDFMEKYSAHMMEKERAAGATEAVLAAKRAEMEKFAELYKNPLFNAGMTFMEVFPVGLLATIVSAGILRRRRESSGAGAAQLA